MLSYTHLALLVFKRTQPWEMLAPRELFIEVAEDTDVLF
jgi:hypothetical protein